MDRNVPHRRYDAPILFGAFVLTNLRAFVFYPR
jgi:hypothetical protein